MSELAPRPSPPEFPTHGLVSLWDMLEVSAPAFVKASQALMAIESLIRTKLSAFNDDRLRDDSTKELCERHVSMFIEQCLLLSVKQTVKFSRLLVENIKSGNCSIKEVAERLKNIRELFHSELEEIKLFSLNANECEFYNAVLPLEVQNAFPRACYDLHEASKCIALDRSTASVLHSMRALEQPLQAMAKAVQVPLKENWNAILNDIEVKVRGKDRDGNRTSFWEGRKEEQAFYAEAASHFFHIKNAWRNHATHGNKEKYTLAEARQIHHSVTVFFEHLSTRLCEGDEVEKAS